MAGSLGLPAFFHGNALKSRAGWEDEDSHWAVWVARSLPWTSRATPLKPMDLPLSGLPLVMELDINAILKPQPLPLILSVDGDTRPAWTSAASTAQQGCTFPSHHPGIRPAPLHSRCLHSGRNRVSPALCRHLPRQSPQDQNLQGRPLASAEADFTCPSRLSSPA